MGGSERKICTLFSRETEAMVPLVEFALQLLLISILLSTSFLVY